MSIRILASAVLCATLIAPRAAWAQSFAASVSPLLAGVTFIPAAEPAAPPAHLRAADVVNAADLADLADSAAQAAGTQRTKAFVYSDAYKMRAKIHRYASVATLPLFALEGYYGQRLYNNPSGSLKTAHLAVASGIGALFAVNAVTGVWNLIDARKDPNSRTKRTVHGVMMLAASAGFLATAATGPGDDFGEREHNGFRSGGDSSGNRSLHRSIAFTSIGLAATSYLIMLFGR